jgi:hypothetical protein
MSNDLDKLKVIFFILFQINLSQYYTIKTEIIDKFVLQKIEISNNKVYSQDLSFQK